MFLEPRAVVHDDEVAAHELHPQRIALTPRKTQVDRGGAPDESGRQLRRGQNRSLGPPARIDVEVHRSPASERSGSTAITSESMRSIDDIVVCSERLPRNTVRARQERSYITAQMVHELGTDADGGALARPVRRE